MRRSSPVPYIILLASLVVASVLSRVFLESRPHVVEDVEFQLFAIGGILFVAYVINRLAPATAIPSFVWAIFAGMALQPFLAFATQNIGGLKIVMEICAAIVLFAGGLEIPFRNFQRWFFPIASLSFLGVVLSAVGFAFGLAFLAQLFGIFDRSLIPSIVILSAALASTDPTAIIPTLESLHLKRGFLKDIAIAESALTDVSGSILTRFLLLAIITAGVAGTGIVGTFAPLFQKASYDALALQMLSGILVGYLGYALLRAFYARDAAAEAGDDPALLLSVPIFTYVLGNLLGGAGFLAAFTAGLFAEARGGIARASKFYGSLLDHLLKPFIFIILGSLVPIGTLLALAPIGILAAFLFMFVVRPLVVCCALFPWFLRGTFRVSDLLFLSFIRETGIIAAILIVIASATGIIASEFVIAIGMWVILLTLVIEPPLTPWVAKRVGVARE